MPAPTRIRLTDLREVECFLTVAEHLHFRKAAEALRIPQPHLSRIIRRLERRLGGVELFQRTSRRVELSAAGVVFAEEARALWAAAERATRRVQLAAEGAAGTLSIGFIAWAAFHSMPEHVTTFQARYPDVRIELSEDNSVQLCAGLQQRALDLAYLRPVETTGLRFHDLATESYCVVVPGTHPWACRAEIPLDLLDGAPFVCVSRHDVGPHTEDVLMQPLAAAGVVPQVAVEVPSVPAAISFVRAGAGFTLITNVHQATAPDLAFVPLQGSNPALQIAIATRRDDNNPIVDAYLEHVRIASREPVRTHSG